MFQYFKCFVIPLSLQVVVKMKKGSLHDECLYLELSHCSEDRIFPLHTSIVFFLMSYCDTTSMKVFLVPNKDAADCPLWQKRVPANIPVALLSEQELPPVVRICRLPAVVESDGNFCRAGLAVVLRHIIQRTYDIDSSRKDVLELLGFKKTCLKACAEVSVLGSCYSSAQGLTDLYFNFVTSHLSLAVQLVVLPL